jgi:hypothetical protein
VYFFFLLHRLTGCSLENFIFLEAKFQHFRVSNIICTSLFVLLLTSKKKKRGARAVGPDKGGRGLRQFSMRGVQIA